MATGKLARLKLTCWWCNVKLMAATHATVKTRDGHFVKVHHKCQAAAAKQEGTTGVVLPTDSVPVPAEATEPAELTS